MFGLFKKKKDQAKDFDPKKVIREGFKKVAGDFKEMDTPERFKRNGYPAWAVKEMGYSATEMRKGGYSIQALKIAGFSDKEIGKEII